MNWVLVILIASVGTIAGGLIMLFCKTGSEPESDPAEEKRMMEDRKRRFKEEFRLICEGKAKQEDYGIPADCQGNPVRPGRYLEMDVGWDCDNYIINVIEAGGRLWAEWDDDGNYYRIGGQGQDAGRWLRIEE